jgi:hypothetical protein
MSSNQLNDISKVYMEAVYGGGKKEEKDTRMVVTNADKKANTKAYQNYKAGSKAYKAADHLKDNYEFARHKASVISRGGRLEDAVESWNQKLAYREAMKEVSEKKEVNVKDTYKTVAAIVDYDRAKKGSKDATYDSMKGDKEGAKKERDYAAWERSKMKKDDPNWKSKKYHTGMHGEGYQRDPEGQEKDRKRSKQTDPSKAGFTGIGDSIEDIMKQNAAMKKAAAKKKTGVSEGYGKKKKKKHDCASKVKHEEFGIGNCIPEMHDLDESGNVSHYDVEFAEYIVEGVPAEELEILEGHMHEHVIREKMAAKDYDGDGKIESGKDEYFGSKDKAIKKAMGKKMKKESLSDWRDDLSDLIEIVAEPESKAEKEVTEKKVKNKVIINPKFTEAVEEMGGELLEMVEVTEEYEPEIEAATEYFYAEGINEEGLDAIIEEVGLDTFVDFVIDSAQDLNEERAARKMSARNLQTLKKKTIPAAKEAEAKRKKEKKGEYSAAYKKKETDVTVYDQKPKAKAKAKAKPAAKKVAAVTKQVKKLQPAKKASKQGIGDKIRGAIKKGVARHQAARAKGREPEKRVKEFGKGFASGVKGAVKFAGKVKKVVSEEELGEAKKKPSVHDDYYDPMEDPEFDPHEAEATRGQSGRGTSGKMNVRKKYPVKEGQVKKELGYLSKAVKTMKGKNIAKADKIADDFNVQALIDSGKFTSQEINAIVEAERDLGDRLHRKRKLYDKTTKKAMQFARDEGEASGHARYRMSSISREMDGIKAKMNKKG